ncbi:MAG TPA: HupE/UreJ family protein [Xanthomonadaceae bacterium]|nr:HupE/UreJ family protein [Xanthomonadaceae bacterium]
MKPRIALIWLVALLALLPMAAFAHKESDAYLTLRTDPANPNVLRGQFDIALRDLAFVIDIDSNHDSVVTWGEVKAHRDAIERYALGGLTIKGDGLTCEIHPTDQKIDAHNDGAYDVIVFDAVCDKEIPNRLGIVYGLFKDVDPYHRGIVTIHAGDRVAGAVLGPKTPTATLDLRAPDRWSQFKSFMVDGIWHIWTGPDHLLFILSLLLPAVLYRTAGAGGRGLGAGKIRHLVAGYGMPGASTLLAGEIATTDVSRSTGWLPVPKLSRAMLELIKVVSGFTVSHSVTLTLSVLGYVNLPSRLVESGIALSIIVAALNNLYPLVTRRAWVVAFAFGFIHGLGFASALAGLSLPPAAMAASLGGFSLGVELGQESIVLPFLPLAFLLRKTRFYQVGVLRWGSWLIIAIATLWLVQRACDVVIPGTALLTPP